MHAYVCEHVSIHRCAYACIYVCVRIACSFSFCSYDSRRSQGWILAWYRRRTRVSIASMRCHLHVILEFILNWVPLGYTSSNGWRDDFAGWKQLKALSSFVSEICFFQVIGSAAVLAYSYVMTSQRGWCIFPGMWVRRANTFLSPVVMAHWHNVCTVPFVFFTAGIEMSLRVFLFVNVTIFRF